MQDSPGQSEISQERRETKGLEGKQGRLTWPAGSQRLGATRVVREEDGQLNRGGPGAGGEAEKSPVQFRGTKCCVVGMANSLLSPSREHRQYNTHCSVMEESNRIDTAASSAQTARGEKAETT